MHGATIKIDLSGSGYGLIAVLTVTESKSELNGSEFLICLNDYLQASQEVLCSMELLL